MTLPAPPGRLAPVLWLLLFAFVLRVTGQILVAFWRVAWLPPMDAWMSGLLPYPYLLVSQFLIIGLCARIAADFTRGKGWFVEPRPIFGKGVLYFGWIYFAAMVVRYVARMSLFPEERWFGGTIPIFFHFVLAAFLILFGLWHRQRIKENPV